MKFTISNWQHALNSVSGAQSTMFDESMNDNNELNFDLSPELKKSSAFFTPASERLQITQCVLYFWKLNENKME